MAGLTTEAPPLSSLWTSKLQILVTVFSLLAFSMSQLRSNRRPGWLTGSERKTVRRTAKEMFHEKIPCFTGGQNNSVHAYLRGNASPASIPSSRAKRKSSRTSRWSTIFSVDTNAFGVRSPPGHVVLWAVQMHLVLHLRCATITARRSANRENTSSARRILCLIAWSSIPRISARRPKYPASVRV